MLSPDTGLPLYRQLARTLRAQVSAGEFPPGGRIPSEPELSRSFGVARPTVRQATELLVREGLLELRRGAGTFVLERPASVDLLAVDGTLKAFAEAGDDVRFEALGPIAKAPVVGLELVAVPPSGPLLALQREGRIDAALVARETLWLAGEALSPLAGEELSGASLSSEIAARFGIHALRARQSVRAVLVDASLEEAPGCDPLPALVIEREVELDAPDTRVFSRLVCRADRIVLHPPVQPTTEGGLPHVR